MTRPFPGLRGQDLNLRPSGYEPDELPDCSTPRKVGDQRTEREGVWPRLWEASRERADDGRVRGQGPGRRAAALPSGLVLCPLVWDASLDLATTRSPTL